MYGGEVRAGGEPLVTHTRRARGERAKRELGAAIHRPLRDWIAAELAVLGVAPGALLPVDLLVPCRPGMHAYVCLPTLARSPGGCGALAHEAAAEQVPAILVGEQRLQLDRGEDGVG